ncbi:MAG: oligosaccharide flippase family protein, partial [Muribaculaceae bacterium]|nr:oligosaccharide flippase family protein [Muribaculaceae bacterium]
MASENTNRIAKNTLYLYLRQAISMIITFATVGITLDVLGDTDYGINNVVAGTVSMFTFLIGTMAVGNQRFYSFYLGKGDDVKLKRIVAGTLFIYLMLSVIILLLGETIGLWFLNNKLVIPTERMYAANWVYQFGLLSLCISMVLPAFGALVTAHENMKFYAFMSIWDAVVRLLTLYLIVVVPFDKLILLGAINFAITILSLVINIGYVFRHYPEGRTYPQCRKEIIKELLGFNCWNLCGNLAWMIKNQGTWFILNLSLIH